MTDFTFNPKILEKINALERDEEYKEFLSGIVEWEKDNDDLKYAAEYDRRFLKLLELMGEA
tara:strand:- start:200 stop:382 length:183 start_codon:yes stop_codon:yes gene_type:complete